MHETIINISISFNTAKEAFKGCLTSMFLKKYIYIETGNKINVEVIDHNVLLILLLS